MNLQTLFKYQEEIEQKISESSSMNEDQLGASNINDLRFLALHIKLAELANLTKCYKYCDVRPNIPKDKLTLRFVDVFQYLLSIGNKANYNIITFDALNPTNERNIIKLFSTLIDQIAIVKKLTLSDNFMDGVREYTNLFSMIMDLAHALKLDFKDVEHYLNSSRLSFSLVSA